MNKIVQRIPPFFSGFQPAREIFTSIEQLLEIPFVKSWTDDKDFYRLSVQDNCLIAELKSGKWRVVGFFHDPVPELPEFDSGIYEASDADSELVRSIDYSKGDEVGLRDGRVLKRYNRV